MTLSGDTVAVVTLPAEQLRPIRDNEIAGSISITLDA